REVTGRPVQVSDKSCRDWVVGGEKDDWYSRGRCLGRWRRSGIRCDQEHLSADQIGRQRRQAIVVTFRPTVFNPYIAPFDIAGLAEALAKGGNVVRVSPGRGGMEESDPRQPLLRARRERPRRCRAAEKGDELAAFHSITKALPMPVSVARPPWLGDPRGSQ